MLVVLISNLISCLCIRQFGLPAVGLLGILSGSDILRYFVSLSSIILLISSLLWNFGKQ